MSYFYVTYQIHSSKDEIAARAQAVAVEQSVEMPVQAIRHQQVLDEILGKVESIEPVGEECFNVVIKLSLATTGFDPAQTLNMLYGNTSMSEGVQLIDATFPDELLSHFAGPQFGMAGLRELVGAANRPLTCTALKPQGISPTELGKLTYTFAQAGIDIIKDDHGLANQAYSPFAERVVACQQAVTKANTETGLHTCYCPNLSGSPSQLFEQAQIAYEEGVEVVMVSPMLVGMPAFYELVTRHLRVPVIGHPAFAGTGRISPAFLFGKLFRLFGCDAVIFPNYGGRFSYSQPLCAELAHAARAPWAAIKPIFPVPAGGMTVERVDEMINFYGPDTILLIGGGLLTAGEKLLERSREFVEKVKRS